MKNKIKKLLLTSLVMTFGLSLIYGDYYGVKGVFPTIDEKYLETNKFELPGLKQRLYWIGYKIGTQRALSRYLLNPHRKGIKNFGEVGCEKADFKSVTFREFSSNVEVLEDAVAKILNNLEKAKSISGNSVEVINSLIEFINKYLERGIAHGINSAMDQRLTDLLETCEQTMDKVKYLNESLEMIKKGEHLLGYMYPFYPHVFIDLMVEPYIESNNANKQEL